MSYLKSLRHGFVVKGCIKSPNSPKFVKTLKTVLEKKGLFWSSAVVVCLLCGFRVNSSLNQSYAGKQFDTMHLVNAGGCGEGKAIVFLFVSRHMFLPKYKITVITRAEGTES